MSTQTAYFNLVTRLTAVTDPTATPKLSAFRSELGRVTDASTMMGKAVATAAGFITYQLVSTALMGVINFVQGSIDAFIDFEYAMAGVARTVQDFAANEQVLSDFAYTMSTKFGISVLDVAAAMEYMGSVGMNSADIMEDFNGISQMSVALQISLEDAINNVVKAQQIWNREGYTATQISDTLNEYTNRTALSMEWLAGALRMGGPAAAATNTSMEEMLSILVELAEAGATGTTAGRGLNTILIQMGLKSKELTEHLRTLKSEGFDVNIEAMRGFAEASSVEKIQMLATAIDGLSDSRKVEIAQMIAGTNFIKLMLPLLQNAGDLTENLAVAKTALGSSEREANTIMETTQKTLEQNEARMTELAATIGEKLVPAYVAAKVAIYEFLDGLLTGVDHSDRLTDRTYMLETALEELTATQARLEDEFSNDWLTSDEFATQMEEAETKYFAIVDAQMDTEGSTKELTNAVGDYMEAEQRSIVSGQLYVDMLVEQAIAADRYRVELNAVQDATEEMERVLSYLRGEMTQTEFETEELTWATQEAKLMYNELSRQLEEANDTLMRTTGLLDENSDSMWDNNHSTAELRYEQLLLDQQLKDGTITEENYTRQSKILDNQMLDLRVTSASLALDQMELKRQFDEEKESVDGVTGKIDLLKGADDALESSIETLSGVVDNLSSVLETLNTTLTLLGTEMGLLGDASGDLEGDFADDFGSMERTVDTDVFEMLDRITALRNSILSLPDRTVTITTEYETEGSPDPPSSYVPPPAPYQPPPPHTPLQHGFEGWVNQPTAFLVGEKGAEYVSVRNQNQNPGEGGRGGMGKVTINLPNVTSVEDPQQVRRVFRRVMLELSGER